MGAQKQKIKAALDTNVIISALLHRGETQKIRDKWKSGAFEIVASQAMLDEYVRVLNYPKFGYGPEWVAEMLSEEILPWTVKVNESKAALPKRPSDPDDEIFLRAALNAKAAYFVTGDKALLELQGVYPFEILGPGTFLKFL